MTANPYQSPEYEEQPQKQPDPQAFPGPGKVSQVRLICILMILQGIFELLVSILFLMLAVLFPNVMFVVLGTPALVAGGLHVFAGIVNYRFRNRAAGGIALIAGVGSATTCICMPTTFALTLYGATVYFDRSVIKAFEMGDDGNTAERILAAFQPFQVPPMPCAAGPYYSAAPLNPPGPRSFR